MLRINNFSGYLRTFAVLKAYYGQNSEDIVFCDICHLDRHYVVG